MVLNNHKFQSSLIAFILAGLLISLLGLSISHAQLAAFPGAEGTGAYAVGGRYGDVYHVTTTSSSQTTPGSFYYGIANAPTAGRTIVFDVSGYIHTGGTYTIGKSKITIAGQTAPGDGIGFKDGTINLTGNDLIIRNIRFRDGNSADSVDLGNNSNIMMDHCDVMFSNDENLSSFGTPPDLFTFQWCMNSWGMETHSCGGLWDQNRATCHHSLWSHNHTRNPKVRSALLDWVNNVTFDWDIGFIMGDSSSGANWNANVRGSYFVSPPGNTHGSALEKANLDSRGNPNFHLYIDDSAMDGDGDGVLSVSKTGYALASGSYGVSATPFPTAGIPVTIDDHLTAYKKVLSATGPVRMDFNPSMSLRDELNTILVNNVIQQRRFHVNAPGKTGASNGGFGTLNSAPPVVDTDQDGMPDFWESTLGSNPALDDHTNAVPAGAFVPTGYTRLEEYLQFLMMPHTAMAKSTAAVPNAIDVDLHKYTLGFTNRLPVTYTISNVTTGTVTVVNGYLAHFVPPTNFYGRARFDFTVTDGDGSTWTQTFATLVSIVSLPRDLIWKGDDAANNFDTNTLSFLFGTNVTAYSIGDNVTFDDSGSTNPAVNLVGSLTPSSVTVSATKSYTLGGSGAFIGGMKLKQSGGGTLNVNTANAFTGGGTIDSSTLVLNSGGDIGNGGFTLQNATITSTYGATASYSLDNLLTIPDGTTSTINLSPRMSVGGVSGNGTLNLNISGTVFQYDNLNSAYGGFTGTLNLTGTVPNALVTAQFNGGAFDGNLANATVKLDNVALIGRHNSSGNTFYIGALTGTATSGFQGSGFAGPMILMVGGLNRDTEFAGSITSVNNTNRIVKVGTGTWTLSGSNNFSGALIVSNGTVLFTGSDAGNVVNVMNGGMLRGTGYLAGGVSIQSGGKLLPGLSDGQPGTLTTSNNLTLATPYLYFDLSGSSTGANDRIVMNGGSIAMSGVQNFVFYLTELALGTGTYKLIEGATGSSATGVSLASNLPGNTRQSLNLYRSSAGANPSYVRLDVSGSAASLLWTGTNGSAWDAGVTTNWLNASAADKFFNLDTVTFDDTSTNGLVTATPFNGTVQPVFMVVSNNTRDYTINGGGIAGQTTIVKNGSGMLTLSPYQVSTTTSLVNGSTTVTVASTNGIAPGQTVNGPHIPGGTTVISILNSTNVLLSQPADVSSTYTFGFCAVNSFSGGTVVNGGTFQLVNNPYGGGTGPIALNGATLYLNGIGTGTTITCAGTNTLLTYGQPLTGFALTGSGVLNLNIGGGGVFSPFGDWSGFSGTINFLTGNWMRELSTIFGSSNAVWNFGSNGGIYNRDGAATVYMGALFGGANTTLAGGQAGKPLTTYIVGGVNTNSVFDGTIVDGGLGTALIFNGPGSLTLTASNTYSANTIVNGGTLIVNNATGSGTGLGDLQIASGAGLAGSGSISGLVSIADGATLAPGNSPGTLSIGDGLVLGDGSTMNFELGTVSDSVNVTGDLTFGGTLNITNLSGFGAGAYTLFTYGGQLSFGRVTLGNKPAGYNYSINTGTPGQVKLVVTPATPPNFGSLSLSGGSLIFSGGNGVPLGNYYVISSTNLAFPLTNWTRVATNQFDASGGFNFTNALDPNSPQSFYRLQIP
jgi:autotransporter-associated beta strand protein